jgi:hypothetical protein
MIDGFDAVTVHDHHAPVGDLSLCGNGIGKGAAPGIAACVDQIERGRNVREVGSKPATANST